MSQLLLVGNPAPHRKSRKHRSPAQKAATRRMLAANRSKRRPTAHKRRKTHRAVTRTNPVTHRTYRRRVTAAAHHYRRRARRNPIAARLGSIKSLVTGAGIGAVGAIGVDAAFGFVSSYLPASLSTEKDAAGGVNYGYFLAKGAMAVAAAMLLKKAIGGHRAAAVAQGSLTVTLYRALAGFMSSTLPSVKLGAYVNPAPIVSHQAGSRLAGVNRYLAAPAINTRDRTVGSDMRSREGLVR
jgi:hypothetical protein